MGRKLKFQPDARLPVRPGFIPSPSNSLVGGPQPGMSQDVSICPNSQKSSRPDCSPTHRSRLHSSPPRPQPVTPAQAGISAFRPSHLPAVRPEPFTLSIRPQPRPIHPFVLVYCRGRRGRPIRPRSRNRGSAWSPRRAPHRARTVARAVRSPDHKAGQKGGVDGVSQGRTGCRY